MSQPKIFASAAELWASLLGTALVFAFPQAGVAEIEQIAQLQLTNQSANAIDLVLDAVEEQPETAEAFFLRYPNLTDTQKRAIQEIYAKYEVSLQAAIDNYLVSANLLNNLVHSIATNAAIAYAREVVVTNERLVYDLLFQRMMATRAVLEPEQQASFSPSLLAFLNLGAPIVASTFPVDLIGQSTDFVIEQLISEGWELSVQTPRTLMLDKDEQRLDLVINQESKVEEASLTTKRLNNAFEATE
jgi:hypothetical protein